MPLIGFTCTNAPWETVSINDCRACEDQCMPIEILNLIWDWGMPEDGHYHSDPNVISVTEAIGCLRKGFYNKTRDYGETPRSLQKRALGSVVHKAIEDSNKDGYSEVVFSCPLPNGKKLMGSVDRKDKTHIKDWKNVDRPRKGYRDSEAMQVNVYEQMAGEGPLDKQIVQLSRGEVAVHPVHDIPDALETVMSRATMLGDALDNNNPETLEKEGPGIKFWRNCACDYCAHVGVCDPTKE